MNWIFTFWVAWKNSVKTRKKNPVCLTRNFKLENVKNQVQIHRGIKFWLVQRCILEIEIRNFMKTLTSLWGFQKKKNSAAYQIASFGGSQHGTYRPATYGMKIWSIFFCFRPIQLYIFFSFEVFSKFNIATFFRLRDKFIKLNGKEQ